MAFPSQRWLHSMLIIISVSLIAAAAARLDIPRLSPTRGTILERRDISSQKLSKDFETFYYPQTLDHFNFQPQSYAVFKQKYVMNFKHWGGAKSSAPIFVYFGAEEALTDDIPDVVGILQDNAEKFKALLLYIEHRYYGDSMPFGSRKKAYKNATTLGYFNSAQAIADYAEIIMHVKNKYHANFSPVIVIGGSYGGMLASWFRLKYPHVALGALASSAPILYFDNITPPGAYYTKVTKDFREASESCYETIKKSWYIIDKVASRHGGLSKLSTMFKTCKPLKSSSELKDFLDTAYASAAQYNAPPRYPVNVICGGIDGSKDKDILAKIFAGLVAYRPNRTCYEIHPLETETDIGWSWQTCSDLVIPVGIDKGTMFQPSPFNLTDYVDYCHSKYGVNPRPHSITSYFGGHDIRLILKRFGSNIIFSNGLRDPYSSGGVLESISRSIIAIPTVSGSHCLDILSERETDPKWLTAQRRSEMKIIKSWLAQYYADLVAYKYKKIHIQA